MRIGVDASNITSGGGLTHLVAFLEDALANQRYSHIVLWSASATLARLPPARDGLEYRTNAALNGNILQRVVWTSRHLAAEAQGTVDVLFVPGGLYLGKFRPFVTMCRNMLPFDPAERARFGWSREGVRLRILRVVQALTFQRADRLVFLSDYAKRDINRQVRLDGARQTIVPHGIAEYFRDARPDYDGDFRGAEPELVYVSTLMPYKYQLELVEAVARLASDGCLVRLKLVGSGPADYEKRVRDRINALNLEDRVVLVGQVAHRDLPALYADCDGIVYASGCENFPNILVEAMATGLPVISSDRGPMPDILGQRAIYFDPGSIGQIVDALRAFVDGGAGQRRAMAEDARRRAQAFSWEKTFSATQAVLEDAAQACKAGV